jgi:Uncharacterized conserved protein
MQVSITSEQSSQPWPLSRDSKLPTGFIRESGRYLIAYEGAPGILPSLCIGDEAVAVTRTVDRVSGIRMEWEWEVSFYAGEVVLELTQDEHLLLEVVLDVAPHPGKLGAEAYEQLLGELQELAEGALFGGTPARARLEHARAKTPPMARFSLLIAYMAKLERAFSAIEATPHRRLQALREERSLVNVRRVDSQTLKTALRRMPVLTALTSSTVHASYPSPRVNVPIREHTFDTSPNRYVLSLLLRLKKACELLCETFEQLAGGPNAANTTVWRLRRWSARATGFRNRFERLIRNSSVLDGLSPQAPDTAALMAISRHPAYALFDQLARRVLEPAVSIGDDADKVLSLRSTYTLYEYWCFFAVASALRQAIPGVEWQQTDGVTSHDLFLNLSQGLTLQAAPGIGRKIVLSFQECYSPGVRADGRPGSISRECNPDIVLTIEGEQRTQIFIFDAKYRSAVDSIHAGLDDMHVYRDAIRTAEGHVAINAAFILTPTHDAPASRFYTQEYRQRHGFGAFDLAPGKPEQVERIADYLRSHLAQHDNNENEGRNLVQQ